MTRSTLIAIIGFVIFVSLAFFAGRWSKDEISDEGPLAKKWQEKADFHKARADSAELVLKTIRAYQQTIRDTITVIERNQTKRHDHYIPTILALRPDSSIVVPFLQADHQFDSLFAAGFFTRR